MQRLFFFVLALALLFFYLRGFVPHDEGWIIHPIQRTIEGDIPYKDFHFIYTPGVLFLGELVFKLFGQSVIVARLLAFAITFLTAHLIFNIAKLFTNEKKLWYLATLFYVVFVPFHINFLWPSVLVIPLSLLSCLFLAKGFEKKQSFYFFLSGIMVSTTFMFKQNFGVAIGGTILIFILCMWKYLFPKKLIFLFSGIITGFLVFSFYLISKHAFVPFLNDFYYFMYIQGVKNAVQATPFIYPGVLYRVIPKTLFYLLPLLISLFALLKINKTNSKFISSTIFVVWTLLFYLCGIRPTTDFLHLLPLLGVSGIPLVISIANIHKAMIRNMVIACFITLICSGFYSSLFRNYYRWEDPLILHNRFSRQVSLFVNDKSFNSIEEIETIRSRYLLDNNYLFIYDYLPLYYFITKTKNPTKFEYFPHLAENEEKEVIANLDQKNVEIIITTGDLTKDTSLIGRFIKNHYTFLKYPHFNIWIKN